MGAADVVPGVSGGTIAFISGIYEELLESIDGLKLNVFKVLEKTEVLKVLGNLSMVIFYLALFLGIAISITIISKAD